MCLWAHGEWKCYSDALLVFFIMQVIPPSIVMLHDVFPQGKWTFWCISGEKPAKCWSFVSQVSQHNYLLITCEGLQYLNWHNSKYQYLPQKLKDHIYNFSLTVLLCFSVNRISTLADFQYCQNLQELYIRKNNITDINEVLYLRALPKLKSLWLADNPCAEFEQWVPTNNINIP